MADELTFKSRAQARRYFTERGDEAAVKTVDEQYGALPDYVEKDVSKKAKGTPSPRGYGPLYK